MVVRWKERGYLFRLVAYLAGSSRLLPFYLNLSVFPRSSSSILFPFHMKVLVDFHYFHTRLSFEIQLIQSSNWPVQSLITKSSCALCNKNVYDKKCYATNALKKLNWQTLEKTRQGGSDARGLRTPPPPCLLLNLK